MAKKFTVIYGTNVIIPDPSGEMRPLTFFADIEADAGKNAGDIAFIVDQEIHQEAFIKDNGGYYRRTNTIVSYKVKEITTKGRK